MFAARGRVTVVTPPVAEPVAVQELMDHLRVAPGDERLLAALISTSRDLVERQTGRTIPTTVLRLTLDGIPGAQGDWWDGVRDGKVNMEMRGHIELPRPPLVSVSAVTAYDDSDNATVMSASNYFVDATDPDTFGRVCLRVGAVWPPALRTRNGYTVDYTAGYATVPAGLKQAILMMAAWLYKNRGDIADGDVASKCGADVFIVNYVMRTMR